MEVNMAPSDYLLLLAFDPTRAVIFKSLFKTRIKREPVNFFAPFNL